MEFERELIIKENNFLKDLVRNCNRSMKDAFELLTAFQDMHRKDKAKSLSHYDKARQVVGSLRQQLTAMDVQLLDLRQQILSETSKAADLKNEVQKLTNELRTVQELLQRANEETDSLRQRNVSLEEELETLKQSLANSENLLSEQLDTNQTVSGNFSCLRKKFDELLEVCDIAATSRLSLLDEVARLTAELQESRRSLDVLREGQRRDSEEHKQNADRLRMQLSSERDRVVQLQNTLSEWEDCVQELRGKQTKYRGHMDYMQQEVSTFLRNYQEEQETPHRLHGQLLRLLLMVDQIASCGSGAHINCSRPVCDGRNGAVASGHQNVPLLVGQSSRDGDSKLSPGEKTASCPLCGDELPTSNV